MSTADVRLAARPTTARTSFARVRSSQVSGTEVVSIRHISSCKFDCQLSTFNLWPRQRYGPHLGRMSPRVPPAPPLIPSTYSPPSQPRTARGLGGTPPRVVPTILSACRHGSNGIWRARQRWTVRRSAPGSRSPSSRDDRRDTLGCESRVPATRTRHALVAARPWPRCLSLPHEPKAQPRRT